MDQSWNSPEALVAALNKGGFECVGWETVPNAVDALARGECKHSGRGVVVSTYKSAAEAQEAPRDLHTVQGSVADTSMLVGVNWTVSCSAKADCEAAEDVVGGRLVHYPRLP